MRRKQVEATSGGCSVTLKFENHLFRAMTCSLELPCMGKVETDWGNGYLECLERGRMLRVSRDVD